MTDFTPLSQLSERYHQVQRDIMAIEEEIKVLEERKKDLEHKARSIDGLRSNVIKTKRSNDEQEKSNPG